MLIKIFWCSDVNRNILMLIKHSEGIDVNKISASKECNISHYWYFLNKGFKFQPNICNRCHDLWMCLWTLVILILSIQSADYCCITSGFNRSGAIKLMGNINLIEKHRTL